MKCPTCKTTLAEFDVRPGVRVIVTVPSTATPEMLTMIQNALAEHFPENPILLTSEQVRIEAEDEPASEADALAQWAEGGRADAG